MGLISKYLKPLIIDDRRYFCLTSNTVFLFHFFLIAHSPYNNDLLSYLGLFFLSLVFFLQFFYLIKPILFFHSEGRFALILVSSIFLHLIVNLFELGDRKFFFESMILIYHGDKFLQDWRLKLFFRAGVILIFAIKLRFSIIIDLEQFILYVCLFLLAMLHLILLKNAKESKRNVSKSKKADSRKTTTEPLSQSQSASKLQDPYSILNSFNEAILLFDENSKVIWMNENLFDLIGIPQNFQFDVIEDMILSIKQEGGHLPLQSIQLKNEQKIKQIVNDFQSKILNFSEARGTNEFIVKSMALDLKKQENNSNFKSKTFATHRGEIPSLKFLSLNEKTDFKQAQPYYLNINGTFDHDVELVKPQLKTVKDFLEGALNFRKEGHCFFGEDSIKWNNFNMYGTLKHYKTGKKQNFFISFSPNENGVFVCLRNLSQEDLITTLSNNKLSQNRQFASMCHELRTPVNSVTNMLEIMQVEIKHDKDDDEKQYVETALINSKLLLSSINDFLDYFSISTELFLLEPEKFNLMDLTQEIFGIFNYIAKKKNLKFRIKYDTPQPCLIHNDSKRLRQILLNLLNNSFRFTSEGSIKMKVQNKTKDFLKILIKDTGTGIDSLHLKTIANIGEVSMNQNQTTGGFGLFIANHLANYLGPTEKDLRIKGIFKGIKVKTIAGKGSKFSFFVKKNQGNGNDKSKENHIVTNICRSVSFGNIPFGSENNILNQMVKIQDSECKFFESKTFLKDSVLRYKKCDCSKILAVDDNDFNLFVLNEKFKQAKIKIDMAHNGVEAIKIISDFLNKKTDCSTKFCDKCQFYKLIIMDIDMPLKNGYQTTKEIKNLLRDFDLDLPIVALSAFSNFEMKEKALESGMESFFEKPFSHDNMEKIIQKYLS